MYEQKDFDFSKYKAFFAFGREQLEEWMEKNNIKSRNDLISLSMWLVALKSNYKEMLEDMSEHYKQERLRRIKEVGKEWIIKYELANYESYYTGEIDDALEVLEEYWYTREDVLKVFNEQKEYHND